MDKEKQKKLLKLALYAGELLMRNGAEVSRVEDTISRIIKACGIEYVETFAVPTGIFINMDTGDAGDEAQTFLKQIKSTSTNLDKIAKINSFSRDFVSTDMTIDEGMEILRKIDNAKPYPLIIRFIGSAMGASAFSALVGANLTEAIAAFFVAIAAFGLSELMDKYDANFFIRNVCCAALAAFISLHIVSFVPDTDYEPIIVGVLMLFVPGVAITNCIRDLLGGQLISGESRLSEVILTGVSLAAGAGIILKLWALTGGVII